MNITVKIETELRKAAREFARDQGCTLDELIEQGLRMVLAKPPKGSK